MNFKLHLIDPAIYASSAVGSGCQVYLSRPAMADPAADRRHLLNSPAPRFGEFWIPQTTLLAPEIGWSFTCKDELLRIPVNAYVIAERSRSAILAMGMEFGIRAARGLSSCCFKSIVEVILVLGNDCIPTSTGYQCYAGLACRVE